MSAYEYWQRMADLLEMRKMWEERCKELKVRRNKERRLEQSDSKPLYLLLTQ